MIEIFTLPMALLALAALPVLAAVYLLQSRYRRRVVSSHVIWRQLTAARSGGQRVERFRPPWLLLLVELLILSGLVVAAAGPRGTAAMVRVPVAVVLDDSYAMQAGVDETARQRAVQTLHKELSPGRHRVRLLAAADEPRLIGDLIERPDELGRALEAYQPAGSRADLDAAIARAWEMVGEAGRVMVVTHRPPADDQAGQMDRLRWIAVGAAEANVAIVGAWRSTALRRGSAAEAGESGAVQSATIELANFAVEPAEAIVRIEQEERAPQRLRVTLGAGQTRRISADLHSGVPARVAIEGQDALAIDDQAVLLDSRRRPVRVAIAVTDQTVAEALHSGLAATDRVAFVEPGRAELLITDAMADGAADAVQPSARRHVVYLADAEAGETGVLAGPFALDTSHSLIEGLSLAGVLWSVGQVEGEDHSAGQPMRGEPLIMAGNQVLLSAAEHASRARSVYLRWRAEGSNLTRSPDWVVLLDNLVRWRMEARPGTSHVNTAVGEAVTFRLPRGVNRLTLRDPTGQTRQVDAPGSTLTLTLDRVGLWRYEAGAAGDADDGGIAGSVAVNAVNAAASDLRGSQSGQWGAWSARTGMTADRTYRDLAWLVVLAVVGLLLLHAHLVRRGGAAGE